MEEKSYSHPESGIYFGLDGVGRLIWEAVSEGKTLTETIELVVAEYDVGEAQAQADVVDFVGELVDKGLVTTVRG